MKSGIVAAEAIIENIKNKADLSVYEKKFKEAGHIKNYMQLEMLNQVLVGD